MKKGKGHKPVNEMSHDELVAGHKRLREKVRRLKRQKSTQSREIVTLRRRLTEQAALNSGQRDQIAALELRIRELGCELAAMCTAQAA